MSQFRKWFNAQFGDRQLPGEPTDDELRDAICAGSVARNQLNRRERWDAEFQAASYARNAAPDFDC